MHSIYKGSIHKKLKLDGGELQPYLLSDHTHVLTKKSIQRYFGQSGKIDWISDFSNSFMRYGIVTDAYLEKIANPVLYNTAKFEDFPTVEEGYSTETLKDICKFIIQAKDKGFLSVLELKFANAAQKILDADTRSPLGWQIDEITGFNLEKSKIKRFLADYMAAHDNNPALEWIATFTDSFWEAIFAYFGTNWQDIKTDPGKIAAFIHNMIFRRLDTDVYDILTKTSPKREYRRKRGPQENHNPGLRQHLELLLAMMSISGNSLTILEQLIERTKPLHANRPRVLFKEYHPASQPLNSFDIQLKKGLELKKEA